jgi:hypothetical protein
MIAIPWFLDGGAEFCILLLNSTLYRAIASGLAELVRMEKQLKLSGSFAFPVA